MDLDDKQKKLLKRVFYGTLIVVGIITFALLIISYSNAPEEYPAPAIALDKMPLTANKVENARSPVNYEDIDYGQDIDLVPITVHTLSFFEKNKALDRVDFSVDYKGFATDYLDYYRVVVFVRGVRYSELPKIYYYREERLFWSDETSVFGWYRTWGISSLSATEKPPWLITVKYHKTGLGFAIVSSVIVGGVVGLIVAAVIALIAALMLSQRNAIIKLQAP